MNTRTVRLVVVLALKCALPAAMGCRAAPHAAAPMPDRSAAIDLAHHFQGHDGCLVLLDCAAGQAVRFNPVRCATRLPPCSTFKIPNSLIGLDTAVIADAEFALPWDGVARDREALNRDHTLRTAFRDSVVWYYQEVARRIGLARMQRYVDAFAYGNRDLSAGLTEFWLDASLTISADEHILFIDHLRRGDLPLKPRSMQIVRDIMVHDEGPGWMLRGKTGSARASSRDPRDLGWFVGWLERDGRDYVFATNISGDGTFGGQARDITLAILRERGLLPARGE